MSIFKGKSTAITEWLCWFRVVFSFCCASHLETLLGGVHWSATPSDNWSFKPELPSLALCIAIGLETNFNILYLNSFSFSPHNSRSNTKGLSLSMCAFANACKRDCQAQCIRQSRSDIAVLPTPWLMKTNASHNNHLQLCKPSSDPWSTPTLCRLSPWHLLDFWAERGPTLHLRHTVSMSPS